MKFAAKNASNEMNEKNVKCPQEKLYHHSAETERSPGLVVIGDSLSRVCEFKTQHRTEYTIGIIFHFYLFWK